MPFENTVEGEVEEVSSMTLLNHAAIPGYSTFSSGHQTPPTQSYFERLKGYLPSLSTLGYGGAAVLSTLPFAPYCFTSTPENISFLWWSSMSVYEQAFLITNAAIFLGIGTATRFSYFPFAVKNLKDIFKNYCNNFSSFTANTAVLFVSAIAATPAAALGYQGAVWAGNAAASCGALANFVTVGAFRIIFIPQFLQKINNLLDVDKKFQQNLVNYLKHLKQVSKEECDLILSDHYGNQEIDEQLVSNILQNLFDKAIKTPIFDPFLFKDRIINGIKLLPAIGMGILLSEAFFIFSSQAGFLGFRIVCQALTSNCPLDELAYGYKLSIAIIPGLTAAIVAFLSGFALLDEFIGSVYRHLKEKPADIIKLVLVVAGCLLTAISIMNAAKSLASHPNLFGLALPADTVWGWLYVLQFLGGNYGLGFTLDVSGCARTMGLTTQLDTPVSINNVERWLNNNSLSPETIQGMRRHRFFNSERQVIDRSIVANVVRSQTLIKM